MSRIFEGLKVIDCGSFIAAPLAATLMGDFGADVIKIEPPGSGDPYRNVYRLPGMPKSSQAYNWLLDNRGKRGLALDLGNPEGQSVLHRLVAQADVFITNYPLAVRTKLAIDHEAAARVRVLRCGTPRADRVMFVGRDAPHKNLDRLVRGFAVSDFRASGAVLTLEIGRAHV